MVAKNGPKVAKNVNIYPNGRKRLALRIGLAIGLNFQKF